MPETIRRAELAAFLRARRERLDPLAAGLHPGPRRRTPGLRREEVAELSGVSLTWYTWLEQQRDISVSRQVLDGIARALQLNAADRQHLFTLADVAIPVNYAGRPVVDETLRRLVIALDPNPAYVINPWWDLLAYNASYAALLGGIDHRQEHERNSLWLLFTGPTFRDKLVDWDDEAAQLVGQLRANVARYPDDPRAAELVSELRERSSDFDKLWETYEVRHFRASRKRFDHGGVGRLDLDYVKLQTADDGQQQLIVFLPSHPGDGERLRRLAPE